MADEINNPSDGGQVNDGGQGNQTPNTSTPTTGDNVTLSKEEFAQLMTNMATMQTQLELANQVIQSQGNTGGRQQVHAQHDPDQQFQLDQLTNTQLVQYINAMMQKQISQPVMQAIMTLSLKEELREVKAEFPDFDKYKDGIYAHASKNPQLGLRDAYLLAKAGATPTAPQGGNPSQGSPEPKTKELPTSGDRGNLAPGHHQTKAPVDITTAAQAAAKELGLIN